MLSSKVVHTNQSYNVSFHSSRPGRSTQILRRFTTGGKDGVAGPVGHAGHDVDLRAIASGANSASRRSCSQERIMPGESFGIAEASEVDLGTVDPSPTRPGVVSRRSAADEFEMGVMSHSRMETPLPLPEARVRGG